MFPNRKFSRAQLVVYQEVYDRKMDLAFARGRTATLAGTAQAHFVADSAAFIAAIQSARPTPASAPPSTSPTGLTLLDKPTFRLGPKPVKCNIFAAVVKGENEANFRNLELLVRTMCEKGVTDHILLVGPPSVGKTMTATLVARAVERPLLPLSGETLGEDLLGIIQGPLTKLYSGAPFSEAYRHPDNRMEVLRVKPTTIFVDEVHKMPGGIQTSLLMGTENDCLVPLEKGGYIDFQDVLFIFGTTEPHMLNKPLRTRFTTIPMVHYSAASIAEMIQRKYPQVPKEDALFLARCSKLYPREALRFAKQAINNGMPAHVYADQILGADERGLDATDRQLLDLLESTRKYRNPQHLAVAKEVISNPGQFTAMQVAKARAMVNTTELKPMYLNALADKLMLTNSDEIRARVHYLETLGLVLRTASGVVRQLSEPTTLTPILEVP